MRRTGRQTSPKDLLRSTVAVVCAASVGATPATAFAQSERPARATSAVEIKVGEGADFSRVEFHGRDGAGTAFARDGDRVVASLQTAAEIDVGRLRADPPKGVEGVETRVNRGRREVVFRLAPGADARFGRADGAAYIQFYAERSRLLASEATSAPPLRADPVPASGVVRVAAEGEGGFLRLTFPWAAPVGAAVFRRGEAIWIVFDAKARLDLARELPAGTGLGRARWTAAEGATVVRIDAPEATTLQASAVGGTWTVLIGAPAAPPAGDLRLTREDHSGPPVLVAGLPGASRLLWVKDPSVGDHFAVVTATGSGRRSARTRALVDANLLQTAQGLAIEPNAGDLRIEITSDVVRLSRPSGMTLSARSAALVDDDDALAAPRPAVMPAAVDFESWSRVGPGGFRARHETLQRLAAEEAGKGDAAPIGARMALARFLVGAELSYEAIGVLNLLAAKDSSVLADPEFRGLRGAAKAMVGRWQEALADLSSPALAADPSAALWRGYVEAKQGHHPEARRAFQDGARAVDLFPARWKARFATAHAQAAMETGDQDAARTLLNYVFAQPTPPLEQLTARLVQARLFELEGRDGRALAVYEAVSRASLESLSTPAQLAATRIRLERKALTPSQAVERLDRLRFRWRGDGTELEIVRTIGEIYLSQGRYREALEVLRGTGLNLAESPGGARLQTQLAEAFRALFLEGRADALEPIQAVALFYDFRELTPVGAEGDEMVRRLSRRLVDVDLLPQAAELLQYQVDNRLDGAAKASVAADLAAIYLMNRQAEKALQALWGSRNSLVGQALANERRLLEARALAQLGRSEHALEILGRDTSQAAQDIRAEVYWRQKAWPSAAAAFERRLGDRWKSPGPLTGEEENLLIRAAVAFSLAGDAEGLARLNDRFGRFADQARSPEAVRIALFGLDGDSVRPADFARIAAQAESFSAWAAGMKARFRQQATASRPAAPRVAAGAP